MFHFYEALKTLVKKYGIIGIEEERQGNNYLPTKSLTLRSFAILMVRVLDKVEDKLARLNIKVKGSTKKFESTLPQQIPSIP